MIWVSYSFLLLEIVNEHPHGSKSKLYAFVVND